MEDPSSPLQADGEDLLQAALSDAFSVGDLRREPAVAQTQSALSSEAEPASEPVSSSEPAESTEAGASLPSASAEEQETWKAEYDSQVAEWRRRRACEGERGCPLRPPPPPAPEPEPEPELEHESESEQETNDEKQESESGWESVSGATEGTGHIVAPPSVVPDSSSPAVVQDLVTGEAQGGHVQEYVESIAMRFVLPPASSARANVGIQTQDTTDDAHADTTPPSHAPDRSHASSSPHWEDIPSSLNSSFPSMSFPETSRPHSPDHPHSHQHDHPHAEHAHDHHHHHEHDAQSHAHHTHLPTYASTTLAVFDDSLSTRTRAWALLSSLSINMFLPFVNGVMLGFGEIFARNVVGWLGWRVPGTVATNVGVGVRSAEKKRKR
ncbi:hypothetical protein EW146_g9728 [Bondarzewia mesenterica]|uniref:Mitochondrial import protein 1 n=1 Tax=Bondarzewia mesenterica TaxID=1095465 RepID=A0A4S4L5P8_9AGAM|nr:hypothetical protein EW146_g9728 [Bondarzewia mesenterica]